MKVLILGGGGMMGHELWKVFSSRFDALVTLRNKIEHYAVANLFEKHRTIENVTAEHFDSVIQAFARVRPQAVVNCIGIVKQQAAGKDPMACLGVNSLFPHRLARLCAAAGARLLHLSTDCVFSGKKGHYREDDFPDAEDLYGRSKLLGEVTGPGCLTLRTSIIGRELHTRQGLIEWFLGQAGKKVSGYTKAIFSGLTTKVLADLLGRILTQFPHQEGLWHVAAEPISKHDLLRLVRSAFRLDIAIEPDESFHCDRSLDGARFAQASGWKAPTWPDMVQGLCG